MINCLILAGGGESVLTASEKVSNKALIKIEGSEMITNVIEALSPVVRRRQMVVVGPTAELRSIKERMKVMVIPDNGSIIDNIAAGVKFFGNGRPILVSSSDIPLISRDAVTDFLDRCDPYDLDLYCPIVSKDDIERMFPGARRTYVKMKEGTFTGGNIFLVNPLKMDIFADIGSRVLEARKNPLRIASLFGMTTIFRVMRGVLSLRQAVDVLERYDIRAKPIVSRYPEIGFDVDKIEDLEAIRGHLSRRRR